MSSRQTDALELICANSSLSGYRCLRGDRFVRRADQPLTLEGGGQGRWMKRIVARLGRGKQRRRYEQTLLLSLWEWAPLVLALTSAPLLRNVCRVFLILPLKLSPHSPPFFQGARPCRWIRRELGKCFVFPAGNAKQEEEGRTLLLLFSDKVKQYFRLFDRSVLLSLFF